MPPGLRAYFDVPEPDEPLGSGEVVLPVEALEPVVGEPPLDPPVDELGLEALPLDPLAPELDELLGSLALPPVEPLAPVEPAPEAPPLVLPLAELGSEALLPVEPPELEVSLAAGLELELELELGVEPDEPGVLPVLPEVPPAVPPSVALGGDAGEVGDAPTVLSVLLEVLLDGLPDPPALPVVPVAPLLDVLPGVLPAAPAVLLSDGVVAGGVLALGGGVLGVLAVLLGVDVEPPAPPAAPALGSVADSEPSRLHPANAIPIKAVTRTTLEDLTIAFMGLPFTWSWSRMRHRQRRRQHLHRTNPCRPMRLSFASCRVCRRRSTRRTGHPRHVDRNQQRRGSTLR